jgi:ribosomal protein L37AE/L43A
MNLYHCKHCGKTVKRNSDKVWVKSYCEKSGKTVHLVKTVLEKRERESHHRN